MTENVGVIIACICGLLSIAVFILAVRDDRRK